MNRDFSRPPSQPIKDLPVIKAAREAYGCIFRESPNLLRALALPLGLCALIFLVSLAGWLMTAPPPSPTGGWDPFLFGFITEALFILPSAIFGIAWYRTILLSEKPPIIPRLKRRYWRFFGYLVAATSIIVVMLVIAGRALGEAAFYVSLAVATYVVLLRSSFVFPAIAIDEEYGLRHSWAHTKGQSLRLIAVLALVCVPIVAALDVLFSVLLTYLNLTLFMEFFVLLYFNSYVAFVGGIAVTAIAFRICTGWHPANRLSSGSQKPENAHTSN